ncbi:MAG TPA: platelet-activating factor acetylhydrolase IB subunit [Candidatus Sulfotelmatobacter sp.]|nr:platelet-activating factor acetylhydrolase IB subunit [Candidatus Sulfotelmatobacter sp.]
MKLHLFLTVAVMLSAASLSAQTTSSAPTAQITGAALIPATRANPTNWMSRHLKFVAQAKRGGIDILFLGDSITDFWRTRGSNVWNQYYAPRHAANFGISGDRTQHVLWRIENGELDGIHPKVTVLMIGTNNSKSDSAEDISKAIGMIIDDIHSKIPDTKILLLAIFPRNTPKDTPESLGTIAEVNNQIETYDNGDTVRFLDIGSKFLGPDGKVHKDVMADYLHPTEKGYKIWAAAMEPTLEAMLK